MVHTTSGWPNSFGQKSPSSQPLRSGFSSPTIFGAVWLVQPDLLRNSRIPVVATPNFLASSSSLMAAACRSEGFSWFCGNIYGMGETLAHLGRHRRICPDQKGRDSRETFRRQADATVAKCPTVPRLRNWKMGQSTGHWRYANGRGRETLGKRSIFTEKFASSLSELSLRGVRQRQVRQGAVTPGIEGVRMSRVLGTGQWDSRSRQLGSAGRLSRSLFVGSCTRASSCLFAVHIDREVSRCPPFLRKGQWDTSPRGISGAQECPTVHSYRTGTLGQRLNDAGAERQLTSGPMPLLASRGRAFASLEQLLRVWAQLACWRDVPV